MTWQVRFELHYATGAQSQAAQKYSKNKEQHRGREQERSLQGAGIVGTADFC